MSSQCKTVLVTGATGYVGGRLVPALVERSLRVRCLVRDPSRLEGRGWLDQVEVVSGDVLDPASLDGALSGVDVAYYLVHSMRGGDDYAQRDQRGAQNFASAAKAANVQHIVYLGGLGDSRTTLSAHLQSRQQTGDALRSAGVAVTELRAGVVVGSGSLSFELIRYLTERLPIMVCPKWVYVRTQPIAIRDLLAYLTAVIDEPRARGRTIEIGGRDVVSYGQMMLGYANARGLWRRLLPVPVLTPRLSSYWLHFVTPVPVTIARPLILGLRSESIVRSDEARELFPDIVPMSYIQAVERSLARLDAGSVETSWTDSLSSSQGSAAPKVLTEQEGMILERRQVEVQATAAQVFRAVTGVGGKRGWPAWGWAWKLRGWLDRLAGGVGLRRGRRHPQEVRVGEAVDFWRIEAVIPDRLFRLRAEMKVPGRAWLQFHIEERADGKSELFQTAFFAPKGLLGLLYWYSLYPIHRLIFSRLVERLAEDAERECVAPEP